MEHADVAEPDKVCSSCGGAVMVEILQEQRDGTEVSVTIGTCLHCAQTFTDAEVLALQGPASQ